MVPEDPLANLYSSIDVQAQILQNGGRRVSEPAKEQLWQFPLRALHKHL